MPRRGAAERRGWGPLGCGWVEPPSGIGSSAPCRGGRGGATQQAAVGVSSSEALSAQEASTKAYDAYDREEKNAIVASPPTRGFPVAAPCAPPRPPPPPLLPPGAAWPPSPTPPPPPSRQLHGCQLRDGWSRHCRRRQPPRQHAPPSARASATPSGVDDSGSCRCRRRRCRCRYSQRWGPLTLAPSAGPSCRPLASLL